MSSILDQNIIEATDLIETVSIAESELSIIDIVDGGIDDLGEIMDELMKDEEGA